jgi:hypothetical protein
VGFEPTIAEFKREMTVHGSDGAATMIGILPYTEMSFEQSYCKFIIKNQ